MSQSYIYAGFWIRLAATLIDNFLFTILLIPFVLMFGPADYYSAQSFQYTYFDAVVQLIFAVTYIGFWVQLSATPGKILLDLKILDAATGQPVNLRQAIIRYVGYFISILALCIGLFWIAFDPKKQGWHDKMAKTVVVKVITS